MKPRTYFKMLPEMCENVYSFDTTLMPCLKVTTSCVVRLKLLVVTTAKIHKSLS